MRVSRTLVDGLTFGESPRWDEVSQRLWFSDQHARLIGSVDTASGEWHIEAGPFAEAGPSGLGWTPGAERNVWFVSMQDRRILSLNIATREVAQVADLAGLASFHCNDMLVTPQGWAYVGHFGFDYELGMEALRPASLLRVEADGKVHVAASDLLFPNGMALLDSGRTLVVSETFRSCLTAFSVDCDSGELSDRRIWANLKTEQCFPDGISPDMRGGIWVASARGSKCIRVEEGGAVTHTVKLEEGRNCFACELGGLDGRTLFLMTAESSRSSITETVKSGRIEVVHDAPFSRLRSNRLFVMRHGPTAYTQGPLDSAELGNDLLDETSVKASATQLAAMARASLQPPQCITIYSSPFGRCLHTARLVQAALPGSQVCIAPELRELDGMVPSKYRTAVRELCPDVITPAQFMALPSELVHERVVELSENSRAFVAQLETAVSASKRLLEFVQSQCLDSSDWVVLVTHCALLAPLLGRMQEKGSIVEIDGGCVPLATNDEILQDTIGLPDF